MGGNIVLPARHMHHYVVKFVWGKADSEIWKMPVGVLPGQYDTIVNIHNPGREALVLWKVAMALCDPGTPSGGVLPWNPLPGVPDGRLGPDAAAALTQYHVGIPPGSPPGYFDGFVVLQCAAELDVVAVYTAGLGTVSALHMERVPARAMPLQAPDLVIVKQADHLCCEWDADADTITVQVANHGNANAPAARAMVDLGQSVVAYATIPPLAPGQQTPIVFDIPRISWDVEYTVTLNYDKAVFESCYTNNTCTGNIVA